MFLCRSRFVGTPLDEEMFKKLRKFQTDPQLQVSEPKRDATEPILQDQAAARHWRTALQNKSSHTSAKKRLARKR